MNVLNLFSIGDFSSWSLLYPLKKLFLQYHHKNFEKSGPKVRWLPLELGKKHELTSVSPHLITYGGDKLGLKVKFLKFVFAIIHNLQNITFTVNFVNIGWTFSSLYKLVFMVVTSSVQRLLVAKWWVFFKVETACQTSQDLSFHLRYQVFRYEWKFAFYREISESGPPRPGLDLNRYSKGLTLIGLIILQRDLLMLCHCEIQVQWKNYQNLPKSQCGSKLLSV